MQRENRIRFRIEQRAGFNQSFSHGGDLFAGLENEPYRAGDFFFKLIKHQCRAKQHGGVTVMSAGMHFAGMFRVVRQFVDLVQRQRVHIRPQGNVPAGFIAA